MPAGVDPDDYVIHQQDVQAVVNALWAGGAEAMMLQDQRVISTSAVRCVGNTLILQGRVYSPPYVITAIGDRDAMRAALDTDPAVANLRDWSIAVGLGYDVGNVGAARPSPPTAARSCPSTPRSPPRESRAALVGWTGELLITLGVLLLLFVAWQLWWTDVAANRAQDPDRADPRATTSPAARRRRCATTASPAAIGKDGAFAVVRIPRFGADYARPVIEGTGRPVLALGVGHYVGTAGPGQVGNFAVAGHRTTYGRPFHDIDQLEDGDPVVVETAGDGLRLRGDLARDRASAATSRSSRRCPASRAAPRPRR